MSLQSLRGSSHGRRRTGLIQGLRTVDTHHIGAWRIEIDRREIGTTVRRTQFSAIIHRRRPYTHEFLTGFKSKSAALKAAQDRITEIAEAERPVWRPAGWRTCQRK